MLDSVIRGNGSGDSVNGVGITVKARDDSPSYSARPATLTGVRLLGNTVAGNTSAGIRFGEPGKNNLGPTDVHVNQNNIETNTAFGLNNQTQTLTDGTCNWWGSPTGPTTTSNPGGTGDRVSTNVTYTPWLTAPAPVGACAGPSTPGKVTGGGQVQGDPVFSALGELLSLPALVASAADPTSQASFGFVATCCAPTGNLEYDDHSMDVRIKAQSIDSLRISSPGTSCSATPGSAHATFGGTASVIRSTGTATEPFTVDVDDCGEPGTADTFGIKTTTYSNGPTTLTGGNIQIHK